MFHTPKRHGPDLIPLHPALQLLIYQPAKHHVVAPYQIQPMLHMTRRFFTEWWGENSFDGGGKDQVRRLVVAEERPGECAAVGG